MPTPRTNAPEMATSQAGKEETHNEGLRYVEQGATRYIVKDKDENDPPGTCADGDAYIVAATASGAWTGEEGNIAFAMGTNASNGWGFETPIEGSKAYVQDENGETTYNGSAWSSVASSGNPVEFLEYAVSDETTALTTGVAKITFRMPYAFTLSAVRASVTTAPTGSTLIVDINEAGSTILSTKLSIDASEKTSTTAASAAVISDTSLADDAEMTIDIDQIGSTIAGAGLKVKLIGTRT